MTLKPFVQGFAGGVLALVCALALMGQTIIQSGGGLPGTAVVLTDATSCPTGTTELTARGRFLVGNPASGTVGTTLGTAITNGADASYTPAGTNSAATFTGDALGPHTHTFTGSGLSTHQHDVDYTFQDASPTARLVSGNYAYGQGASFTRTLRQDPGTFASDSASATASLTSAVSGGTPAGTNSSTGAGTPTGTNSAATFTGTANTTMRGTISPYLQLLVCKQS